MAWDSTFELLWKVVVIAARLMFQGVMTIFGALRTHRANRQHGYQPKHFGVSNTVRATTTGKQQRETRSVSPTAYTILLPRRTAWDAKVAQQFVQHLITLSETLVLRIVADQNRIVWQIVDPQPKGDGDVFSSAVRAFYPSAEIVRQAFQAEAPTEPFFRSVVKIAAVNFFPAPLVFAEDLKDFDPLNTLTQALGELSAGERVSYTVVVGGNAPAAQAAGIRLITTSNIHPLEYASVGGVVAAEVRRMQGSDRVAQYQAHLQKVMEAKLEQTLYHACILLQIDAPTAAQVKRLEQVATHMQHFGHMPFNTLVLGAPLADPHHISSVEQAYSTSALGIIERWLNGTDAAWRDLLLVLDARELAALWHLPAQTFTAAQIAWLPHTHVPLPRALRGQKEGVVLGVNRIAGHEEVIRMTEQDRATHTFVIGKTGLGKSTLLHNLIHQDIADKRGVAVIDPRGDLVAHILACSIPPEREQDVVLLDFAQDDFPPPLNPLLVPTGGDKVQAAGRVMTILEELYEGFGGQRMADTLNMALLTLMSDECPTLRDVSRLFRDRRYRQALLEKVENAAVEDFWAGFDRLSANHQQELIQPIEHRLRSFYANPTLYPILCSPHAVDFYALMQQGKIILVSFSLEARAGAIPPREQRLLGSVLVSQLQIAAMAGATQEHSFRLAIDEVRHFIGTSLDTMLSEARARRLSLTLASQYLKQLAGETLDAVMGNVGTMVLFGVDDLDARALAPYVKPHFAPEDLLNFSPYHAALRLRFKGAQQEAFSLATVKAPQRPTDALERATRIRQQSAQTYTPASRQAILEWLKQRYPKLERPLDVRDDEQWYDKG
jgi:hypothetical protein